MNAFNRLIAGLIVFLLLALFIALAAAPGPVLSWLQQQLSNFSAWVSRFQVTDPTNFTIARVAVVIAALLLFTPLLMAEFGRKGESVVRLPMQGGSAQVTTESIGRRLAWHLDQLADVITVQPTVRARGAHVDIALDIETTPEVDVPMKTEEVVLVTREVVEDRMGIKLGRLDVRIRHSDFPQLT